MLVISNRLDGPESPNTEPDNDNCGRGACEYRKSCQRSEQLVVNASEAAVAEDHNYISGSSQRLHFFDDFVFPGIVENRFTCWLNRLTHFPREEPVLRRHLFYTCHFC